MTSIAPPISRAGCTSDRETRSGKKPQVNDLNRGFRNTFRSGRLSIGLVAPIEAYPNSSVPALERHVERAQLADRLGFAAIWVRDVPFNVPSFGDAGQIFDPFTYLGLLVGKTQRIALGTASIILPLRHPAHVAKAAATVDALSGGRLLLGVASGDRPEEYPAMAADFEQRGALFRQAFEYIRHMAEPFPTVANTFGSLKGGADLLPKPAAGRVPLLVTGSSRQDTGWTAVHADGWMTYPRDPAAQANIVRVWREQVANASLMVKPVMQPLYVDLADDEERPTPIHLGFRAGMSFLRDHIAQLQDAGVNHVALNLRFNRASIEETLHRLAEELLPGFHTGEGKYKDSVSD